MILGVTGSRDGLSRAQYRTAYALLLDLKPTVLHHGDCVGVDEQVHAMALRLGIPVVLHPPDVGRYRAFCQGADITWKPKPYLTRDRDIVACVNHLIGFPDGIERPRSGTWATIRYAQQAGIEITVVAPDGTIEQR